MIEANQWLTGFCLGTMASLLYFWGLWITVHRLRDALNPLGLYATSLVLRLAILGIVLSFALSGGWQQLFAAAIAFAIVRFVVVYVLCKTTFQPGSRLSQLSNACE